MYEYISWPEIRKGGGAFAYYNVTRGCERHLRVVPDVNGCAPMHIRIRAARLPRVKAPADAEQALAVLKYRTTAYVDWILTEKDVWNEGEIVYSPDLLPIISEMYRLPGWARRSPLLLLFENMARTDKLHEIDGFSEYLESGNETHGWLRSTYLMDEHDSLLVLE